MKGFIAIVLLGLLAVASCESEEIVEKSAPAPHRPQHNIYTMLTPPVGHNQPVHLQEPHKDLLVKPLTAISIFKRYVIMPIVVLGVVALGIWVFVGFVRSFIVARSHEIFPFLTHIRNRRDIHSHVDDLTATVMAAISSQECLQRATCELGHHANHLQISSGMLPILDKMSTKSVVQAFQVGLNGKQHCNKYVCDFKSS